MTIPVLPESTTNQTSSGPELFSGREEKLIAKQAGRILKVNTKPIKSIPLSTGLVKTALLFYFVSVVESAIQQVQCFDSFCTTAKCPKPPPIYNGSLPQRSNPQATSSADPSFVINILYGITGLCLTGICIFSVLYVCCRDRNNVSHQPRVLIEPSSRPQEDYELLPAIGQPTDGEYPGSYTEPV